MLIQQVNSVAWFHLSRYTIYLETLKYRKRDTRCVRDALVRFIHELYMEKIIMALDHNSYVDKSMSYHQ